MAKFPIEAFGKTKVVPGSAREVEEIWGPGSIERVILRMLDSGQPNNWKATNSPEFHHGRRQRTTAKVVHFPTGLPIVNAEQAERR